MLVARSRRKSLREIDGIGYDDGRSRSISSLIILKGNYMLASDDMIITGHQYLIASERHITIAIEMSGGGKML